MTATIRLPRILGQASRSGLEHEVMGSTVREALESLFESEPGLRNHLLDEAGRIRPHVLLFVQEIKADLETPVPGDGRIQVLQAVSGGSIRHPSTHSN